jgi:pimeloyl-ACP methyl ester carboxylesterase
LNFTIMRLTRRRLFSQALGCAALAAMASKQSAWAQPSVEILDFEWRDPSRDRIVPVRIYLPAGAGPKPLVMFSHGLGGSRMGYSYLAKHLAAAGYICVHPQHAGSDRAVWTGNPFSTFGNLSKAAGDENAIDRAKDITFVLNELLTGAASALFANQINPQWLAMAGHSYGANTTLLISGATVQRAQGQIFNLGDPRFKCAVVISAPPFHGAGDMNPILGGIAIPTLHITGTEDVIRVPGYGSSLPARIDVFNATSCNNEYAKRKHLFVFDGATHGVFTDRIDRVGPVASAKIKAGTSELARAFLDIQLRGAAQDQLSNYASSHKADFSDIRLGNS